MDRQRVGGFPDSYGSGVNLNRRGEPTLICQRNQGANAVPIRAIESTAATGGSSESVPPRFSFTGAGGMAR